MTNLSVNVNKIALLRNSRGNGYPCLVTFVEKLIDLGVNGITVHPRPDERHITSVDVKELSELLSQYADIEFNIEGYPSEQFMKLVIETKPDQCTLVPDLPNQLTSDHGWDVSKYKKMLMGVVNKLKVNAIRVSLFLDPFVNQFKIAKSIGVDRIELYTEQYGIAFNSKDNLENIFNIYKQAAASATKIGLGVNAGHDLNLHNLPKFLSIPNILEVSIGHALVVESILQGMDTVVGKYLDIVK